MKLREFRLDADGVNTLRAAPPPLVDAETQGRVTVPGTERSSLVTLLPLDGPATAGSQM